MRKLWHMYTMEHYSVVKRKEFESFELRWMNLESIIQTEVSQKENNRYSVCVCIYMCIYMESRKVVLVNLFAGQE